MRGIWAVPLLALAAGATLAQVPHETLGRAATEPLRDTRLREDKIPPILQLAKSAPYSTINTMTCASIAGEIAKLDSALGPDADVPGKQKGEGAEVASAAAGEAVRSIIPGLGLVKVVTGADKQQRRVEAAVYAGGIRRAYLKGLGLSRRCPPGAVPRPAAQHAKPELMPAPAGKY